MQSFGNHKVDVWKTITIAPNESININKVKAPVTLEIKNLSDKKIALVSGLKTPSEILGKSEFKYRLPKKSTLKLENRNTVPVSIYLHYYSSQAIIVNDKELK
ncbi:hypothetical protein SAMN05421682_112100 [Chryseobacterium indoltheticum]|uniref:Uncharacterized protein n=2 Tax=Chryseobacterium indoltheticum TaxID=254 RepID=A0A381F5R0_9FLAO|nr:hypothetical protein SAMN05421682_112100 [Chryseobacterium indoltheticum]SUX41865.1 Uncharacterised protein [Chryseobacterium indoltheticum]